MSETLRDRFWLWGHEANCYHRHANNVWHIPGTSSRMTPAEAAVYLGIPNVIMVRFGNQPQPPFRQHALPLLPLKRFVWSIVGDSGSTDNDRNPDIQDVLALVDEFPNLTGAIMDDFFRRDPARPGRYSVEQVAGFRRQLRSGARPLDLYIVAYTHDLAFPIQGHLAAADAITFWTWQAAELKALETNFATLEGLAPASRKLLGIYMWDFGTGAPVPMEAMEHQCRLGLEWLKAGRVEGLVFLASCIADVGIEAVEYARRLIARVGDEPLPAAVRSRGVSRP
jgi:hypothetical protein